ncbi:MAG: phosphotransferase [Pseudomonadota bacterium]
MNEDNTPLSDLLPVLDQLAQEALSLWDVPAEARTTRINVSENVTYRVDAAGFTSILRIHRAGYNSPHAIACELDWLTALGRDTDVTTPTIIPGRNGARIQQGTIPGLTAPRFMVMFAFIDGHAPDETSDLAPGFEELGAIAARCHDHVLKWDRPAGFDRLTWDENTVFGPQPTWGDWRDAPGVTDEIRPLLERLETTVITRLRAYGKAPDRFNLIHADMRLANLIVGTDGTRLIDFDDCGFSWFLYDFAAAISFFETDPRIPDLKAAWLRGYRSIRPLSAAEEAEMDTFIMLRRMALLAWIGSHIEAPEPQALAPHFAAGTAALAQSYLSRFGHS